ncbi:MAG: hypothetical protein R6T87_07315 [Marinobacter sp.]
MMEKRNLIEEDRTPDLDEQGDLDAMDKEASSMFENPSKKKPEDAPENGEVE